MKSLQRSLLPWYKDHRRDLPWRDNSDPYRVWVSELMLQQTQVSTVIPYFERFIDRFPDVRSLADGDLEEVLALWSGLGYYRRARALHRAAQQIVTEHRGDFPHDLAGWLALPGVGRYTAGAVLSIAFNQRVPILDGNVSRVLARVFAVSGDVSKGATKRRLWELAEAVLPDEEVSAFNQALMELGALVCRPSSPKCLVCPLRDLCQSYRQGIQEKLPEMPPRVGSVKEIWSAGLVRRGSDVLLYRRTSRLMEDLWELPGGTCGVDEAPSEGLVREARARYGARIRSGPELARVRHSIMNKRITLHTLAAELDGSNAVGDGYRWVAPNELNRLAVSSMYLKVFRALKVI